MSESSQEQTPNLRREQPSATTEQNPDPPPSFNNGNEDAKADINQTRATGVDSIQGGTMDVPTTNHVTAPASKADNIDEGRSESKPPEDSQRSTTHNSSQTKSTKINNDNNGPVFDGDTAG